MSTLYDFISNFLKLEMFILGFTFLLNNGAGTTTSEPRTGTRRKWSHAQLGLGLGGPGPSGPGPGPRQTCKIRCWDKEHKLKDHMKGWKPKIVGRNDEIDNKRDIEILFPPS